MIDFEAGLDGFRKVVLLVMISPPHFGQIISAGGDCF